MQCDVISGEPGEVCDQEDKLMWLAVAGSRMSACLRFDRIRAIVSVGVEPCGLGCLVRRAEKCAGELEARCLTNSRLEKEKDSLCGCEGTRAPAAGVVGVMIYMAREGRGERQLLCDEFATDWRYWIAATLAPTLCLM